MNEPTSQVFTDKDKLAVYLKEYDAMRAEITARTSSYTQMFTIVVAISAALFVIVPKADFSKSVGEIIQAFAPVVAIEGLLLLGAYFVVSGIWKNTRRIGSYIAILERRINSLVGTEMGWERFSFERSSPISNEVDSLRRIDEKLDRLAEVIRHAK